MKRHLKTLDQRGAASLISVAIFAVIITIITTLYIRTVVTQQRDALNYDLSNRAFYASLAGFEDTKRAIDSGLIVPDAQNRKSDCKVNVGSGQISSQLSTLEYTCQLVNFNPDTLQLDQLPSNSSGVFPIKSNAANGDYRLKITWKGTNSVRNNDKSLPTQGYWEAQGLPAMMRSQLVVFPNGGAGLNRDNIKSGSVYLNPSSAADSRAAAFNVGGYLGWNLPPSDPVKNVQCTTGANSICEALISINAVDFQAQNIMLVLKPLYANATNISIALETSSGDPANFSSGQAQIDITGRSGDVFRRTKQSYPYGTYQVGVTDIPDYALIAGEGICKQAKLRLDSARYEEECTPEAP